MARGSPWHGTGPTRTSYTTPDPLNDLFSELFSQTTETGGREVSIQGDRAAAARKMRRESLVRQAETVMRELEKLTAEEQRELEAKATLAEALERYGDDDYETGAVITWTRQYPTGRMYHYAALKAGGSWWLTGKTDFGMSWQMLVDRHLRHSEDAAYVETVMPI